MEPYRTELMEFYSTALWHLQEEVALSALAQELLDQDKVGSRSLFLVPACLDRVCASDVGGDVVLRRQLPRPAKGPRGGAQVLPASHPGEWSGAVPSIRPSVRLRLGFCCCRSPRWTPSSRTPTRCWATSTLRWRRRTRPWIASRTPSASIPSTTTAGTAFCATRHPFR